MLEKSLALHARDASPASDQLLSSQDRILAKFWLFNGGVLGHPPQFVCQVEGVAMHPTRKPSLTAELVSMKESWRQQAGVDRINRHEAPTARFFWKRRLGVDTRRVELSTCR